MAAAPAARPRSRAFHGAGKATMAASRMTIASTPLQPFLMFTAKRGERSIVSVRVTSWPSTRRPTPLALAIWPVNGSITRSLTGFQAMKAKLAARTTRKVRRKRTSGRRRRRGGRSSSPTVALVAAPLGSPPAGSVSRPPPRFRFAMGARIVAAARELARRAAMVIWPAHVARRQLRRAPRRPPTADPGAREIPGAAGRREGHRPAALAAAQGDRGGLQGLVALAEDAGGPPRRAPVHARLRRAPDGGLGRDPRRPLLRRRPGPRLWPRHLPRHQRRGGRPPEGARHAPAHPPQLRPAAARGLPQAPPPHPPRRALGAAGPELRRHAGRLSRHRRRGARPGRGDRAQPRGDGESAGADRRTHHRRWRMQP